MTENGLLSLENILKGCIDREKFSIRLYEHALEIVQDPAGIRILKELRSDEIRHARLLKEALDTGNTDIIGNRDEDRSAPLTTSPTPVEITEKSRPKQIIAFAIYHEEKAIDYFSRYVDTFRGTPTGELFEKLKAEEEKHRDKLQQMARKFS